MEKGCFGSGVITSDRAKIGGKDKGKSENGIPYGSLSLFFRKEKVALRRSLFLYVSLYHKIRSSFVLFFLLTWLAGSGPFSRGERIRFELS